MITNKSLVFLALFTVFSLVLAEDKLSKADSLLNQKNYSGAINEYKAILKQSTNYESAWFGLENTYIQKGDFLSVGKIEQLSLSDRLYWGYVRSLFYSYQFDSTLKYVFELSHKFPKSPLVTDAIALGILMVDAGQDTNNLKKYTQAQLALEKSDYNNGIAILQELIVKSDRLAEYSYLLLSKTFIAKSEMNQAISTLNEFGQKFALSKLYPKTRYDLGLIYLESIKDTLRAKDIFENLISDCPDCPESYFARSRLTILSEIKSKEVPK
jgi:tetratricopeptide (TPR) repeat protein